MIESYAEEIELEAQEARGGPGWMLATVATVESDGLTLIFPGQTTAGAKHYKRNLGAAFAAGQRVLVIRDSGTYIAVCPVG